MGQESIYRKAYIWFLLVTSQHALVWKLWPIILDMRLWKLYIFILPIKAIAYLSDYFLFFSFFFSCKTTLLYKAHLDVS